MALSLHRNPSAGPALKALHPAEPALPNGEHADALMAAPAASAGAAAGRVTMRAGGNRKQ
ncbi:hypothetical protein [Burkholderia sp. TSV86]|uniref:hypothetical protein n=1 Tax=Burkholderia sp. TSV86 TaxID=1385594 RepID=UPI000756CF55|nr:hypothetical protein [Burkholderia sp. TSV86]KVE38463.1 hypothetical protein WS68_23380 [Burkholderia sp. TSV86]